MPNVRFKNMEWQYLKEIFETHFFFLKSGGWGVLYVSADCHPAKPSHYSPSAMLSCWRFCPGKERGKACRYLMVLHTSKPSRGLVLLVLPPARFTSVGSQSEMWMSSRLFTPFCFSKGLATKLTPRMPPSHRVHFLPRSGQLLPPDRVCPPLSETQRSLGMSRWKISKWSHLCQVLTDKNVTGEAEVMKEWGVICVCHTIRTGQNHSLGGGSLLRPYTRILLQGHPFNNCQP